MEFRRPGGAALFSFSRPSKHFGRPSGPFRAAGEDRHRNRRPVENDPCGQRANHVERSTPAQHERTGTTRSKPEYHARRFSERRPADLCWREPTCLPRSAPVEGVSGPRAGGAAKLRDGIPWHGPAAPDNSTVADSFGSVLTGEDWIRRSERLRSVMWTRLSTWLVIVKRPMMACQGPKTRVCCLSWTPSGHFRQGAGRFAMATELVGPAILPDQLVRDGVFSIQPAMHSGRSVDLLNVGASMDFAF